MHDGYLSGCGSARNLARDTADRSSTHSRCIYWCSWYKCMLFCVGSWSCGGRGCRLWATSSRGADARMLQTRGCLLWCWQERCRGLSSCQRIAFSIGRWWFYSSSSTAKQQFHTCRWTHTARYFHHRRILSSERSSTPVASMWGTSEKRYPRYTASLFLITLLLLTIGPSNADCWSAGSARVVRDQLSSLAATSFCSRIGWQYWGLYYREHCFCRGRGCIFYRTLYAQRFFRVWVRSIDWFSSRHLTRLRWATIVEAGCCWAWGRNATWMGISWGFSYLRSIVGRFDATGRDPNSIRWVSIGLEFHRRMR